MLFSRRLFLFSFICFVTILFIHSNTNYSNYRQPGFLKSSENRSGKQWNRFEWYRQNVHKKFSKDIKNNKTQNISSISPYYAYEYMEEYSISHLTPGIRNAKIYCRYFDANGQEILPSFESYNFPDHIVNCEKRNGTKTISLSTTKDGIYDRPIPLENRISGVQKYELSYCFSPVFGTEPKWLQLIETVEHFKLQGTTHFYFYHYDMTPYDSQVYSDYQLTGEMELLFILDRYNVTAEQLQIFANQDCILRSRGESKWIIFVDIDERLVMTDYNGTILDYLRNINDSKIGAIQFRQRWIMKTETMPEKYNGDSQIDDWMPVRRWHNTTGVASPGHTAKCVIDPMKICSMWVHYPDIYYPDYTMYKLKPEEGVIRHYRDIKMNNWGKSWLTGLLKFGNLTKTDYPDKWLQNLTENVKKRAKDIYTVLKS